MRRYRLQCVAVGRGIPFIGELCSQSVVDAAQHPTCGLFDQLNRNRKPQPNFLQEAGVDMGRKLTKIVELVILEGAACLPLNAGARFAYCHERRQIYQCIRTGAGTFY